MRNNEYKIIIAVFFTILMVLSFYFGSYLAVTKSHIFIVGYSFSNQAKSLQEFNSLLDPALEFYSPIGQDEIISSYLGIIMDILNQPNQPAKEMADILVKQAEKWGLPIIEKDKGFLYSQNLFKMGLIYKTVAMKYKDKDYYDKAVRVLSKGLLFSPNRPVFLYNLFELYLFGGDLDNAKSIGRIIVKYWPNEDKVKEIIDKF